MTKQNPKQVYQFKIVLMDTQPLVWRQIQVPENYSFWELHVAIQDAIGWHDCHLHEFTVKKASSKQEFKIGLPGGDEDFDKEILTEWQEHIKDWLSLKNKIAYYTYDFGDCWEHQIILEKIVPKQSSIKYPLCINGKIACPPEDCGGPWGYEDLLKVIKNPKHKEHEDMINWLEEMGKKNFDPKKFDPTEVRFANPTERLNFVKSMKLS